MSSLGFAPVKARDIPRKGSVENDCCGVVGHHHLRPRGVAGRPRRGALRGAHGHPGRARALAWNRVCGAIGPEFSDARAVELKCADRATKFYTANFIELGCQ